MPTERSTEPGITLSEAEWLMDVTSTLTQLTQSAERCREIPGFLSDVLGFPAVSLLVLEQRGTEMKRDELLSGSCFGPDSWCERALPEEFWGMIAQSVTGCRGFADLRLSVNARLSAVRVYAQQIDATHRLFLAVHESSWPPFHATAQSTRLELIVQELAKQIRCFKVWQRAAKGLGAPFDRLTDREWLVVRELTSDAPEKEIAARLELSPHTLHTHIKSIYRKAGVRGRLSLIHALNSVVGKLRTASFDDSLALSSIPLPACASYDCS